jgi:hypothetical protein
MPQIVAVGGTENLVTGDQSTTTATAGTSYAQQIAETMLGTQYAAFVAQYGWAAPVGTQIPGLPNGQILDGEASVDMDLAILFDPARIEAWRQVVAGQMNAQSGGPKFTDLSERISDIIIETVAQGASTLEVDVIDPTLALLTIPGPDGYPFITDDEIGFLWPPIDINFPPGTDCVWRLCNVDASSVPSNSNLKLTFEDAIVSELREVDANNGGVVQGKADQTLAGFIGSLVEGANTYLRGSSKKLKTTDYTPIKFVSIVSPNDPNYLPPSIPSSAAKVTAPSSRQNALKATQGLSASQQSQIDGWNGKFKDLLGPDHLSFSEVEKQQQQGGVDWSALASTGKG